jgi:hypothetical protein
MSVIRRCRLRGSSSAALGKRGPRPGPDYWADGPRSEVPRPGPGTCSPSLLSPGATATATKSTGSTSTSSSSSAHERGLRRRALRLGTTSAASRPCDRSPRSASSTRDDRWPHWQVPTKAPVRSTGRRGSRTSRARSRRRRSRSTHLPTASLTRPGYPPHQAAVPTAPLGITRSPDPGPYAVIGT